MDKWKGGNFLLVILSTQGLDKAMMKLLLCVISQKIYFLLVLDSVMFFSIKVGQKHWSDFGMIVVIY